MTGQGQILLDSIQHGLKGFEFHSTLCCGLRIFYRPSKLWWRSGANSPLTIYIYMYTQKNKRRKRTETLQVRGLQSLHWHDETTTVENAKPTHIPCRGHLSKPFHHSNVPEAWHMDTYGYIIPWMGIGHDCIRPQFQDRPWTMTAAACVGPAWGWIHKGQRSKISQAQSSAA